MIISYIIMAVLIIIDVILKQVFISIYQVGEIKPIIDNVLYFGYVQNTGASFGLFQGQQLVFFFITIFALVLFGYFFSKSNWQTKKVYTLAFIFLIAGTLGNAIDRVLFGFVIDYVQMPFLPFVGGTIFNFADVLLNAGVILLFIDILILDTIRHKKMKAVDNEETNRNNNG